MTVVLRYLFSNRTYEGSYNLIVVEATNKKENCSSIRRHTKKHYSLASHSGKGEAGFQRTLGCLKPEIFQKTYRDLFHNKSSLLSVQRELNRREHANNKPNLLSMLNAFKIFFYWRAAVKKELQWTPVKIRFSHAQAERCTFQVNINSIHKAPCVTRDTTFFTPSLKLAAQ